MYLSTYLSTYVVKYSSSLLLIRGVSRFVIVLADFRSFMACLVLGNPAFVGFIVSIFVMVLLVIVIKALVKKRIGSCVLKGAASCSRLEHCSLNVFQLAFVICYQDKVYWE